MKTNVLLASALVFLTGVSDSKAQRVSSTREAKIVAHRGAMADRPENTMAAFERAVELGADVVEIDVRMSRDGRLFILHDPGVDRTTDGSGTAEDFTYDELRRLDAGGWFDRRFSGERIPSLKEVLEWAHDRTVVLLDLKATSPEYDEAVASEVKESGNLDAVVIGVRTPEQAVHFRELLPEYRQLAFMQGPELIEAFADAGADVLRLWLHWLESDPKLATRVRQTESKLMINGTEGELDEAEAIMWFDPDWILIDHVARLKSSLAEIEERRGSR